MTQIDILRNNLIDRLLNVDNPKLLKALDSLLKESSGKSDTYRFTKEQLELLKKSDQDIADGRTHSHESVINDAREWIKKK
ncbi:MAG: hypothetical protein RIC95_15280 [Vicingaceae bacterium]